MIYGSKPRKLPLLMTFWPLGIADPKLGSWGHLNQVLRFFWRGVYHKGPTVWCTNPHNECLFKFSLLKQKPLNTYNQFFLIKSGKYSSGTCQFHQMRNAQVCCVMGKHLFIIILTNIICQLAQRFKGKGHQKSHTVHKKLMSQFWFYAQWWNPHNHCEDIWERPLVSSMAVNHW